jgi:ADP-heptose:LPS heptosyltransferase
MNVDTMRLIDRYVGVPICYILAFINTIVEFVKPTILDFKSKNILFIELSEMGSTILVDPALEFSKQKGYNNFFVIFEKNAKSLEILNTIPRKNIFVIRVDSFLNLVLDGLEFLKWCRRNEIDTCVDLELFSRFTALLTFLSGAKKRVGFYRYHNEGLYRGNFLTHKIQFNPYHHITKNFMSMVKVVHENRFDDPNPKILITDDEVKVKKANVKADDIERVRAKIKKRFPELDKHKVVLLNANSSDFLPQRRWPLSQFAKLAEKILKTDDNIVLLLTGSPGEREGLESIIQMVKDYRCLNFAGEIEFLDLIALYSQATLMVTNDSGPGHFASVTSMPTVVLFGPETPKLYGPVGNTYSITANLACSPCVSAWNHRKTPCENNMCMQAISVENVFATVRPLLDKPHHQLATASIR